MTHIMHSYNSIVQYLKELNVHATENDSSQKNTKTQFLEPPRTEITIFERRVDTINGKRRIFTVKSKCLPIQEFLSANISFLPHNVCIDNSSDDEWQTNIFSGELTITEVVDDRNEGIRFSDIINKSSDSNDYVGNYLDMCEVVYDVSSSTLTRQCDVCDYKTKYPSKLKLHQRKHTGEKPYCCDLCQYRSSKSYSLKAHRRTHTGERPYVCLDCSFACNDPSTLRRHRYTHSGTKPYSCQKCDYKCTRSTHLKRHIMTHLMSGKYECNICQFKCGSKNILKNHSMMHTGKKINTCKECAFTTDDKSTMRRHNLIHSEIKPYSCHLCTYRCRRGAHLRRHLKSHERKEGLKEITMMVSEEDKPLICSNCGWAAQNLDEIKAHVCSMNNRDLFHCNTCNYETKTFTSLKKHKIIHSATHVYSCMQCKRKFDGHEALSEHVLQHFRKKKHTCKECNYSTDFSSSIRKHKLNHIGNFQYKCDLCSYTAKREPNLERHKEIHKNDLQNMAGVKNGNAEDLDGSEDINLNCAIKEEMLLSHKNDESDLYNKVNQIDDNHLDLMLKAEKPKKSIYECNTYNDETLEKFTFDQHLIETSVSKCGHCDFTCGDIRELEKHLEMHGTNTDLISETERVNFRMNNNTEQPSHSEDVCFTCYNCDFSTKSEEMLNKHKFSQHVTP